MLAARDFLHRFYKHEINRVKKTPGTLLVLVRGAWAGTRKTSCEHIRTQLGTGCEHAEELYEKLIAQQGQLEEYASKLGKRLAVMHARYEDLPHLGNSLENHLASKGLRINHGAAVDVFGEYTDSCVKEACASLAEKFPQAHVIKFKSQPKMVF